MLPNKQTKLNLAILLMAAALCMVAVSYAAPMGTVFNYQGNLNDAGSLADGLYDFQFKVYNALAGGTQQGSTLSVDDKDVIDGFFTVTLDFGAGVFMGDARWLQIAVRPGASAEDFTTLSPRQKVTPAPHALALPGLWTQQNATSANLIGGYSGNSVASGVVAATIAGGGDSTRPNKVTDNYGTVGGGGDNQAGDNAGTATDATYATVGGGMGNKASVEFATVGGGADNTAGLRDSDERPEWYSYFEPSYATVGGGQGNSAKGPWSTVGGGKGNTASELVPRGEDEPTYSAYTTVGGGSYNTAREHNSTVGGGFLNTARESYSTVGGGDNNTAGGSTSTVSGGWYNTAWGKIAMVPGGADNAAGGDVSFAAGYRAKVRSATEVGWPDRNGDEGTFVWADSTNADFQSTGPDQFLIRASGGVGIGTNSPNEKLTVEGALSLDEISAPSASAGYGKLYVKSSDSILYFKDEGGAEYDLTAGGDDFVAGDFLICVNDTQRAAGATGPVLLKETKIGRGGSLRIMFDFRATYHSGRTYTVFAQIYRNNVPVGTLRSSNSPSYVTYSENISGWSKGDLVQIWGRTTHPSWPVLVMNLRLYVDNPAEAGARL